MSDIFAVVDAKSNVLLEFSVASEVDYVDVFRYKLIFQEKTKNELLQCPSNNENPFATTCLPDEESDLSMKEEGPLGRELPLTEEDLLLNLNNFDKIRNRGLPENYDPLAGWWVDRQKEILFSLDSSKFDVLSIEKKKAGPVQDETTEFEALIALQAENLNLVYGLSRPDMQKDEREHDLNLDFKILGADKKVYIDAMSPTHLDAKGPLDPEVMRARGEPYQSLEQQVDNLLKSIPVQRNRAHHYNESVIHVISLLRMKPSNRSYFIENFKAKASIQNLDLHEVVFLNTSTDRI